VTVTVTVNGQSGSLTNGFIYTVPPTVSSVSPNSGSTAGGTAVTITGTNFAAGATVTFGGTAATNVVVVNSTSITATTPAGSAAAVTVTVTVSGQSGSLTSGFTYVVIPTVSSVTPNSGSTAGGTAATITGTNFATGATVTFGGTAATNVVVVNSTSITATTPAYAAGAVTVTVTVNGQGGSLTNGFTYVVPPTVSSVSPNSGSTAGGTAVTITGTNFATGATVTFGGTAATNVVVVNSTSITATTPAGSAGAVTVTVTLSGQSGSLTSGFTYVVIPTVSNVSPNGGSTAGGTAVTITGTNFAAGATVTFGGTAATNVVVVNSTSLTATTPAQAAGAVTVTVTVNGQSGSLTNGFIYTVPPTVSSVSPNSGSTAGGTAVTITGTNFAAGATVTFGGTAATNVVVVSGTQITATTPAGSVGAVTVTVTNLGAQSGSLASGFTYVVPTTAISYVQGNYATPQTPQTTVNVTFTGAQAVGDLNVVVAGWNDSTAVVSAVTDKSGNTYTRGVGPTIVSGPLSQSIYYAKNIAAAAAGANIVTVTFSVAAASADIRILEYSGADPSNPVDVTAANSGNSATSSSGSATTTNATDLIFGANIVETLTTGPGSGFTSRLLTSPDGDIAEDRMVTATGSYSATAPDSPSGPWIMQMVAFRTSSGGTTLPSVSNVSPNSGSTAGGTAVTITGTNFAAGATVTFGGTAATNVVVVNSTSITATTPAQAAGAVTVTVTVNGQSGSLTNGFSYTGPTTVISYVQGKYATPQTFQTTVNIAFPAAQAAGDLNVVVVGWNDSTSTVSAVTDSSANTYTLAVGPTIVSGFLAQSIYYAKNIAAAAAGANTVSVTFSTAAAYPDIRILEYSGADPNNPVDVTAAKTGSSTTSSSGSATTTNATDLIFGANIVETSTTGPGSGFTSRLLTSPDGDIAEDQTVIAVGSYSATAPLSSSGPWIMQMVAFLTPSSTGGDHTPPTAPSALTATAVSVSQINLSWTASTDNVGVTGYLLERCQGAGCTNFAQVAAVAGTTTTYSDSNLTANSSYSYRVRATDAAGNLSSYSNIASATTSLSVSPRVASLTYTRTQQFTANFSSVTWSVDSVTGGSASSGTITGTGLYTPPSSTGTHTVTATTTDQSLSASATVYITNYPGTYTYHNDNLRTGQNSNETVLTPSNVNQTNFGKLFSYALDGIAFASPLYVANVSIPGQGFHNVVYVATENDSVYAFDADGLSSSPLWQVTFLNSGATTVPCADVGECGDIPTQIGITGTPVIDQTSGTLYVVAKTKEGTNYVQRLHALDITTGAEKFGGSVVLQGSVPGTGDEASGGIVPFDALHELQRPALLLSNGVVYIGWASHGDNHPWHGWVLGYTAPASGSATTLQQVLIYNATPNGYGAGIWQSGGGLATDATGCIYFVTGNGTFDVNTGGVDYGDTVEKLNPNGSVADYFTPYDESNMDANDLDLGAAGPVLLVDQTTGSYPHLLITAGKTGTIYVINRDNLGHYNSGNNSQIVQSLVSVLPNGTSDTGNFSTPVYFNGWVYFGAVNDTLKAFQLTNGLLSTGPTSQSAAIYGVRGASFAISANGNTNGILWAIQNLGASPNNDATAPGVLFAYDATNLANELYDSSQAGSRDTLDYAAKFSIPLVANGKVFVAGQTKLVAYGLLP
jgi:hypothetical protein